MTDLTTRRVSKYDQAIFTIEGRFLPRDIASIKVSEHKSIQIRLIYEHLEAPEIDDGSRDERRKELERKKRVDEKRRQAKREEGKYDPEKAARDEARNRILEKKVLRAEEKEKIQEKNFLSLLCQLKKPEVQVIIMEPFKIQKLDFKDTEVASVKTWHALTCAIPSARFKGCCETARLIWSKENHVGNESSIDENTYAAIPAPCHPTPLPSDQFCIVYSVGGGGWVRGVEGKAVQHSDTTGLLLLSSDRIAEIEESRNADRAIDRTLDPYSIQVKTPYFHLDRHSFDALQLDAIGNSSDATFRTAYAKTMYLNHLYKLSRPRGPLQQTFTEMCSFLVSRFQPNDNMWEFTQPLGAKTC